jgi:hypothetical protein
MTATTKGREKTVHNVKTPTASGGTPPASRSPISVANAAGEHATSSLAERLVRAL